TGGLIEEALGADAGRTITGKVASAALGAVGAADLVLFVVDGQAGATSDELALVKRLRKVKAPVIVVANKVENRKQEERVPELWSLGLGEPMPVSALHGRGTGDLLDRLYELLPEPSEVDEEAEIAAIAIVGRPNVGKSALFNRLIGEERSIVHDEPGTTRDSVDSLIEVNGSRYRFIDTAGIRRHAKTHDVEIFSASRTRQAIERSDVAILVVDAAEGATAQDQRIARQVAEAGVGCILVLNKWDLITDPEAAKITERTLRDRLHFVDYAMMLRISALTGRAVGKVFPQIERVLETRTRRVPTAQLNELIHEAQQKTPPAAIGGRHNKVLYATQAESSPPTFVLFTTGPLPVTWQRFLERRLREEFDFTGNPLRIVVRERVREERSR
ncbi:MAG TPA: ribosome biogenesis GTPase Der, partial [Actinomycetota bacterium]|nr:ribosome biogenesis GTPase Der [Actinomycetota bacterium]